jgi:hypothetical protein
MIGYASGDIGGRRRPTADEQRRQRLMGVLDVLARVQTCNPKAAELVAACEAWLNSGAAADRARRAGCAAAHHSIGRGHVRVKALCAR